MSLPEFDYLGPYKVERTLGRGGMGTVYKGVHAKSGEAVAVKVIATGIANSSRFRRRFAAEVETLKRLKHPHIVQLVGYGEEQGLLFYSMEYVDGQSLHTHLRQHKKLSWQEVIQIGIETTGALKHAHDIGIIHRDLKPANLMLNKSGQIKLTDFGIAKLFGSTDMTAAGSVLGTADYMPPEQAEGKPVTIRSDLYSLGGVLYALLAGTAPFGGKSIPEVLYAVRYNSVPDLRERASHVPKELAELIHQLLEKDPQRRPPTALVVGNRLKSLLAGLNRRAAGANPSDASTTGAGTKVIGAQLTSLDLSDVDDVELQLTGTVPGADHATDDRSDNTLSPPDSDSDSAKVDTRLGDNPPGTHEVPTLLAPEGNAPAPGEDHRPAVPGSRNRPDSKSVEVSRGRQALPSGTGASGIGASSNGPASSGPLTSGRPSHFTPISEIPTKTAPFGLDPDDSAPQFDWVHYGSLAGIIALLIGSIGLAWWLLQPLSADKLYAQISAAVASGDETQLLQSSESMQEFLTRFPGDERSAELQILVDEVELSRQARVLQRRASRLGGIENLSAIEQGFLQCVKLLGQDPDLAQQKLASFIAIFGPQPELSREDKKLVRLAEHALRVGAAGLEQKTPLAAVQLQSLIEVSEATLTAERLHEFYHDLLALYGDLPWAKPQLDRIRERLEATE